MLPTLRDIPIVGPCLPTLAGLGRTCMPAKSQRRGGLSNSPARPLCSHRVCWPVSPSLCSYGRRVHELRSAGRIWLCVGIGAPTERSHVTDCLKVTEDSVLGHSCFGAQMHLLSTSRFGSVSQMATAQRAVPGRARTGKADSEGPAAAAGRLRSARRMGSLRGKRLGGPDRFECRPRVRPSPCR